MNNFTKIEKYAIINVLSNIMNADGIIHPKEEKFMNQVYDNFSITISEIENIANIDDIQAYHIVRRMPDVKKPKAKSIFMGMAKADGFLHPKEIEIIKQLIT